MKTPKISVIIPVYNTERYLDKCLDSIVKQTLKNIEIIVVNDCSQDNSLEIIEDYKQKDDRIIVINNIKNLGLGGARNVGMQRATGDFISFVDSDDWIENNTLESAYNEAIANNADVVLFRYTFFFEKSDTYYSAKKIKHKLKTPNNIITIYDCPELFNVTSACLKLYKNKVLKDSDITFPEKLYYEDIPFSFKLYFSMNKAVILDEPLYYYRQHEGTITSDRGKKMFDIIKIFQLTDTITNNIEPNSTVRISYYNKKWEMILNVLNRIDIEYKIDFIRELKQVLQINRKGKYFLLLTLIKHNQINLFLKLNSMVWYVSKMKGQIKKALLKK